MKTAIVHDWFVGIAGAERCVKHIYNICRDADIYTLFDLLDGDQKIDLFGHPLRIYTSFLQQIPFSHRFYRYLLPLYPYAIESFDLSEYDLVISSSHAVAKGVITHPHQIHVCYIHTPMRYIWDLSFEYLKGGSKLLRPLMQYFFHHLRLWDVASSMRVDHFIANSRYVAKRVKRYYGRDAVVIYPPVDLERYTLGKQKEDFYLTVSRLVPYKKVDIIVKAFNKIGKRLVVVGDGPQYNGIKGIAGKNIELLGYQSDDVVIDLMKRAKGFVFAALEDFGITPVEALACGTAVICYGKGGVTESVKDMENGVYFHTQSPDALVDAIHRFEGSYHLFYPEKIRGSALIFSSDRFVAQFTEFLRQTQS